MFFFLLLSFLKKQLLSNTLLNRCFVKYYFKYNNNDINLLSREEYQGLLTYYLPDRSVAWSNMFGTMERCRENYDVEDYTIAQTTLEQIFLQFTKYQREGL